MRPRVGGPINFSPFVAPVIPPPNPNLLVNCITFNAANWGQFGGAGGTGPSYGALVADPFGVVDALQVTFSDPRSGFFQIPIPTLAPNAVYTESIYYLFISGAPNFYLGYYNGASPVTQYSSLIVPTGTWQRTAFSFVTGSSDPNPSVIVTNANVDGASQGNVGTVALW